MRYLNYHFIGATFDWTLFDNWNQRKVVLRPSKVAMFDSDLVRLIRLKFDPKIESNKTLIELNLAFDFVWLILISTNLT